MGEKERLIQRYIRAKRLGIPEVQWDVSTYAGYYLKDFRDPIRALLDDKMIGSVGIKGDAVKVILLAVLSE